LAQKTRLIDVAKKAGVSICTASVVLNKTKGGAVAEETRKRVLQVASSLGYRPNRAAQSLVNAGAAPGAPPKSIGIITFGESHFGLAHHASLASYARKAILSHGCEVAFYHSVVELEDEGLFNREIDPSRVGAIFSTQAIGGEFVDRILAKVGRMAVVAGVNIDNRLIRTTLNYEEETRRAYNYLRGLGHEIIAFIHSAPTSWRIKAYKEAVSAANLPLRKNLLQYYVGKDNVEKAIWEGVDRLLDLEERPTAIMAGTDDTALEIYRQLRRRSVSVPEEISVIGLGDSELAARADPPLTTIHMPRKELSETAVELLVRQIEENNQEPSFIELPGHIVERESCRRL